MGLNLSRVAIPLSVSVVLIGEEAILRVWMGSFGGEAWTLPWLSCGEGVKTSLVLWCKKP
jgi:hypothetical protein